MINTVTFNREMEESLSAFLEAISGAAIIENRLSTRDGLLECGTQRIDLKSSKNIFILAIGKAASSMSQGLLNVIDKSFLGRVSGLIITKENHGFPVANFQVHESSHPIPSKKSLQAAMVVRERLNALDDDCSVVVLLSGGGSALMCEPIEGISFEEKQLLHEVLVESGASIDVINRVRRALSKVKGGGLGPLIADRNALVLVLSDVIGNDLSMVSSGPFYPFTDRDSLGVMLKRNRINVPLALKEKIERITSPSLNFQFIPHVLLADNQYALSVLAEKIGQYGSMVLMDKPLNHSLEEAADKLIDKFLEEKKRQCGRFILIGGGEATLRVKGGGKGGRNMHLCCVMTHKLLHQGVEDFGVFSLGTDGTDGPTDAAGGILHSQIFKSAEKVERLRVAIEAQTSYSFLASEAALIRTGPTGTNLNDVHGIVSF